MPSVILVNFFTDEVLAQEWLDEYNKQGTVWYSNNTAAWWNYYTNRTEHNHEKVVSYIRENMRKNPDNVSDRI